MKKANMLRGVVPAIVTPMDKCGEIDFSLLAQQAEYLVGGGVNGLFVCGGTGEGAYLTTEEKAAVFKKLKSLEAVKRGGVFLCLAIINPDTRRVIAEAKALAPLEPDYFVATAPFYYAMNQNCIIEHYTAVANAASAPVIVYNIPSCTHNYIELPAIRALSELPNIAGVQEGLL